MARDEYFGTFTPTKRKRGDDGDEKENKHPRKTMRYAVCIVTRQLIDANQLPRSSAPAPSSTSSSSTSS